MKSIRVLEIVPTLGYGGIASMIMNYYNKIDKKRFTIDFVTHGIVEDYHNDLEKNGSKIFYLSTIREEGIYKYYRSLVSIIISGNYDVIHFHSCGPRLLILPYVKKRIKSKIFVHSHSTEKGRKPAFLWKWFCLHYADELLSCGYEAGVVAYGKKSNFKIIPNAVDIHKFSKELHYKREIKEQLYSNAIGVLHVGAFIEQKNHIFIIELAKLMKEKKENVKFILVGQGPLQKEIENLIRKWDLQEYVMLFGKRNDVNLLLANSDCFILPSLFEGLPVSGIEAQFSECRCILSDNISDETNQHFGNCKFLSLDDKEAWITEILESKKCNDKIDSELLISASYNIDNAVKILEELYAK